MLCKNCNYILSGKENFCPNCAAALKENPHEEKNTEEKKLKDKNEQEEIISREFIFPKKEEEKMMPEREVQIFREAYEKEDTQKKEKPKSYGGRIMLLLFFTCLFAVGAFAVADYFDITPSVFSFIGQRTDNTEEAGSFSHENSIVKPDFNYTVERAYVMSGKGLTLRKGPDKSYAPVAQVSDLTAVQIYGGSTVAEEWVYVYCDEKDCYGWLDGSFLAKQEREESTLFAENINTSDFSDEDITE